MTVESNYMIAIATLSDWLKRLAPVFQPMRRKPKTNRTMYAQEPIRWSLHLAYKPLESTLSRVDL